MKLILVKHLGTETYRRPILKHRNLLTLRSRLEPGAEFRLDLSEKYGVGRSKLGVPNIYTQRKKVNVFLSFFTFEVAKFGFLTCQVYLMSPLCGAPSLISLTPKVSMTLFVCKDPLLNWLSVPKRVTSSRRHEDTRVSKRMVKT